jgi:predicted TIM-barrel enzyme
MRRMERFLAEVKAAGFAGVQNFPTVGLFDGTFRANLEETGLGYDREVEMIRLAREMDLLTTPYVFTPDESVRMAKAGADILVAHMGLTTSGSIGAATAKTLDQCVPLVDAMAAAARKVRGDVIVLCHGGPIAEPDDAAFMLKHCPAIDGFYGASSMERLPTERAIREQTEKFTRIGRG